MYISEQANAEHSLQVGINFAALALGLFLGQLVILNSTPEGRVFIPMLIFALPFTVGATIRLMRQLGFYQPRAMIKTLLVMLGILSALTIGFLRTAL